LRERNKALWDTASNSLFKEATFFAAQPIEGMPPEVSHLLLEWIPEASEGICTTPIPNLAICLQEKQ